MSVMNSNSNSSDGAARIALLALGALRAPPKLKTYLRAVHTLSFTSPPTSTSASTSTSTSALSQSSNTMHVHDDTNRFIISHMAAIADKRWHRAVASFGGVVPLTALLTDTERMSDKAVVQTLSSRRSRSFLLELLYCSLLVCDLTGDEKEVARATRLSLSIVAVAERGDDNEMALARAMVERRIYFKDDVLSSTSVSNHPLTLLLNARIDLARVSYMRAQRRVKTVLEGAGSKDRFPTRSELAQDSDEVHEALEAAHRLYTQLTSMTLSVHLLRSIENSLHQNLVFASDLALGDKSSSIPRSTLSVLFKRYNPFFLGIVQDFITSHPNTSPQSAYAECAHIALRFLASSMSLFGSSMSPDERDLVPFTISALDELVLKRQSSRARELSATATSVFAAGLSGRDSGDADSPFQRSLRLCLESRPRFSLWEERSIFQGIVTALFASSESSRQANIMRSAVFMWTARGESASFLESANAADLIALIYALRFAIKESIARRSLFGVKSLHDIADSVLLERGHISSTFTSQYSLFALNALLFELRMVSSLDRESRNRIDDVLISYLNRIAERDSLIESHWQRLERAVIAFQVSSAIVSGAHMPFNASAALSLSLHAWVSVSLPVLSLTRLYAKANELDSSPSPTPEDEVAFQKMLSNLPLGTLPPGSSPTSLSRKSAVLSALKQHRSSILPRIASLVTQAAAASFLAAHSDTHAVKGALDRMLEAGTTAQQMWLDFSSSASIAESGLLDAFDPDSGMQLKSELRPLLSSYYMSTMVFASSVASIVTDSEARDILQILSYLEFAALRVRGAITSIQTKVLQSLLIKLRRTQDYLIELITSVQQERDPYRTRFALILSGLALSPRVIDEDSLRDVVLPFALIGLEGPRRDISRAAHLFFHKLFSLEEDLDILNAICPLYFQISLRNFPKTTQLEDLATSVTTVTSNSLRSSWSYPLAKTFASTMLEHGKHSSGNPMSSACGKLLASMLRTVPIVILPSIEGVISDTIQAREMPGSLKAQFLQQIHSTVFQNADFSRKHQLSTWFIDVYNNVKTIVSLAKL